jgi:glycosyltransferase involved in cell wall biosynthesis
MGAPEHLLECFPFWLDLKTFDRSALQTQLERRRPIRFISSGRLLNALKGHDLALRALAIAMHDRSLDWEYVIAGTGPDTEILKTLAHDLGISRHVVIDGWLEPDDLRQLYLRSDILIHPSPIHDPFPNAVLEGMAASLVVMGSDVCGSVLDRIESGINGFIHRAGDFHHLAQQIGQVLDSSYLLTEMGQNSRATAELWPVERGVSIVERLFL